MKIKVRAAAASKGGTTIFVVHGHDEVRNSEVTGFLRQVTKLPVVVMERKANLGRTVIEKFEQNAARAAYAVVLLTGDDVCGPVRQRRRRARQNVIFELGYFMAALGRPRVTILYEDGVELLSDLSGLLYVRLDTKGSWKPKLVKELKHAKIDLSKAV